MCEEYMDNIEEVEEINFSEELDDVEVVAASEQLESFPAPIGIVKANMLNLRNNPEPNATVVTILKKGESLFGGEGYGNFGEWAKVKLMDGLEGYVKSEFVEWI